MPTLRRQLRGVVQLLRLKPVASWGLSACLLGASTAYARTGGDVNLLDGGLALLLVVLAQGVVSHGLNDAYDWLTGTDKESIGKGTGGSRVIPEGKMSVAGTITAAVVGLAGVLVIGTYFIQQYGTPMVVLLAVAVWSPVAYSTPPLKLGYRPFNELLVVLPALVGVVVGTDMVLAGDWSLAAVGIGWVHALFSIAWFIVSRVPDYRPDKRAGKLTSVVYVGPGNAKILSGGYLALALAAVPLLFAHVTPAVFVTPALWAAMMVELSGLDPYDAEQASGVRIRMMRTTTAHAIALAAFIPAWGV